jgi:ADP-ribosyltransferase exoenzyme
VQAYASSLGGDNPGRYNDHERIWTGHDDARRHQRVLQKEASSPRALDAALDKKYGTDAVDDAKVAYVIYRPPGSNAGVVEVDGKRYYIDATHRLVDAGYKLDMSKRKSTNDFPGKSAGDVSKWMRAFPAHALSAGKAQDAAEFKEAGHPRQEDGKFGKGGGAPSMPKGMEHVTKGNHKTVASFANALIGENKYSNQQIAEATQAAFGGKTTAASISWYKVQAKKKTPDGIKAEAKKSAGIKANDAAIKTATAKPTPQTKVDALIAKAEASTGKTMYATCKDASGKIVNCKIPGVPDGLDTHAGLSGLLKSQGLTIYGNYGKFDPAKPAPSGGYTDVALDASNVEAAKTAAYAKAQADAKANGVVTELEEQLSPEMMKAIKAYTDGAYSGLNKALRKGEPMDAAQATLAAQLDHALSKAKMAEDTKVYRGMSAPEKFFGPNPTVGTTIIDNGFMSTAKVPEKAWSGTKCEIHVPKGARALDVQSMSLHPAESEVMLPRGSMFKITGIKPDGWIQLEYVSKPAD